VEVGRERVLTTAMIAICRSRTFGSAILPDVNEHQRRVWHRMIEAIDAYEAGDLEREVSDSPSKARFLNDPEK
jgi:hypothetical protein